MGANSTLTLLEKCVAQYVINTIITNLRAITVFGYMSMFGLLILICAPSILDVVMPLNETRERKLIVDVEYFIDQDEYFFTVSCLIIISVIFCITTTLATEMLYIVYVHHVCGMFKITWWVLCQRDARDIFFLFFYMSLAIFDVRHDFFLRQLSITARLRSARSSGSIFFR